MTYIDWDELEARYEEELANVTVQEDMWDIEGTINHYFWKYGRCFTEANYNLDREQAIAISEELKHSIGKMENKLSQITEDYKPVSFEDLDHVINCKIYTYTEGPRVTSTVAVRNPNFHRFLLWGYGGAPYYMKDVMSQPSSKEYVDRDSFVEELRNVKKQIRREWEALLIYTTGQTVAEANRKQCIETRLQIQKDIWELNDLLDYYNFSEDFNRDNISQDRAISIRNDIKMQVRLIEIKLLDIIKNLEPIDFKHLNSVIEMSTVAEQIYCNTVELVPSKDYYKFLFWKIGNKYELKQEKVSNGYVINVDRSDYNSELRNIKREICERWDIIKELTRCES